MLTENQIIAATDEFLLIKQNKNAFKRQLIEQKTANLPPECSGPDCDKSHLQTSSAGSEGEIFALLPDSMVPVIVKTQ